MNTEKQTVRLFHLILFNYANQLFNLSRGELPFIEISADPLLIQHDNIGYLIFQSPAVQYDVVIIEKDSSARLLLLAFYYPCNCKIRQ